MGRTEVATRGPIVRLEPSLSFIEGDALVRARDDDASVLPFTPMDGVALTLGVTCIRSEDGRAACDSFEAASTYAIIALPQVVDIRATSSALLATDAAGLLHCVGRHCGRIAAQAQETAYEVDAEAEGNLASGTAWPVGSMSPAIVVAADVRRVRTDGLSTVCIEDTGRHLRCHSERFASTPMASTDVSDFATAGNALCVLLGPPETARVVCTFISEDDTPRVVFEASVVGATRLHAGGTTLCVEAGASLSCTEMRGRTPPNALVAFALPDAATP